MKHQIRIFNINICNVTLMDLLSVLTDGVVMTPNVDHLVKLQKDELFYKIYQNADWVICDSRILALALKFLKTPILEVIPGASFFPAFCDFHKDNEDVKIFLLGAAQGVALKAQENINRRVGRTIVVGAYSPSFGFQTNKEECTKIIEIINKTDATVLLVGVGAPKQEKWIFEYKNELSKIKLFLPLGATIDFEAGHIKRAPTPFQRLKLEWLYRMFKDPKRLVKRYLFDDLPFFYYLVKQKLGLYRNPFDK